MEGVDWGTYYTFQKMRAEAPPLADLLRGVSLMGSYAGVGLMLLVAVACLLATQRSRIALFLLGMVIGSTVLAEVLKLVIASDRPPDWEGSGGVLFAGTTHSFPSSHALVSAVTYGTLAVLLARGTPSWIVRGALIAAALLVVLLIGTSQLFLGADWLSDVLAGWAGAAALLLAAGQLAPPPANLPRG
jgi:undecaprenyl-diphosphatase